jgi:hypothetical protein
MMKRICGVTAGSSMARQTWILCLSTLWVACGEKKSDKTPSAPPSAGSAGSAAGSGSAEATAGSGSGSGSAASAADADTPKGLVQLRTALGIDGPKAPKGVDPRATARFAVHTTSWDEKSEKTLNEVRIYSVASGKLALESSSELPEDALVTQLAWRDAKELVVLLGDGKFMKVTGGKLEPVARPAASFFTAKKQPGDVKFARDEGLIATASAEIWLVHCAWGIQGDEDPCSSHVYVRVLPTAASAKKAPAARPGPPALAVPDYKLTVTPVEGGKSGTLDCKGPGGVSGKLSPKPDEQQFGYTVSANAWLSREPPIARIEEWVAGMDDAIASPHYLAGCTMPPDLESVFAVRGPAGFWAVSELEAEPIGETATAVFWHGRTVGVVPNAKEPVFAP